MNDASSITAPTALDPAHRKRPDVSFLRRPVVKYGLLLLLIAGLAAAAYFFYVNRPLRVEIAQIENDVAIRVFGLGKD